MWPGMRPQGEERWGSCGADLLTGYCLVKLEHQSVGQGVERCCGSRAWRNWPGLALAAASFGMLISKRWEPQILKMSPRAALLPVIVSDRCWNSQLPEAVLELSVSRLLLSTSLPTLVRSCLVGGARRGGREQGTFCPLWQLTRI